MSNGVRVPDVNTIVIAGRLTRDADVRYTTTGRAVAQFRLANSRYFKTNTSESWQEETTFIDIRLWGDAAERMKNRLKKGVPVLVEGRLRSREWETKEGLKRSGVEVVARRVQFLEAMVPGTASESLAAAPASIEEAPTTGLSTSADLPSKSLEEETEESLEGVAL